MNMHITSNETPAALFYNVITMKIPAISQTVTTSFVFLAFLSTLLISIPTTPSTPPSTHITPSLIPVAHASTMGVSVPLNYLGMVGWWTFDGKDTPWTSSTAATTVDKSGNGNTGTLTNMSQSSSPVAGKVGQGLRLDGTNDWVNPSENSGLPVYGTTGYSVSLWVKGSVPGSDAVIYSEGSSASTYQIFRMQVRTSGGNKLNVNIRDDGAVNLLSVSSAGVVFDNQWHHIVWTDLNGAGKLYIDSQQDSYDFSYTTGTLTLNQSSIGALHRTDISNYFPGSLDDVRVYNRALSASEVLQLYNMGR